MDTLPDNEKNSNAYRVILTIDMGIISNLYFKQFIFWIFFFLVSLELMMINSEKLKKTRLNKINTGQLLNIYIFFFNWIIFIITFKYNVMS